MEVFQNQKKPTKRKQGVLGRVQLEDIDIVFIFYSRFWTYQTVEFRKGKYSRNTATFCETNFIFRISW
ncbi:hypothetical protein D0466_03855 [Peribacillus glennii]|uniref:Uncharacterized protein n=1 Tax=Peribacillus glennii TaxID=2303991 RepID=A0A372LFJ6_9BACI|nr:hypothetical protein D0466_03855 [Peribacillus glennii]